MFKYVKQIKSTIAGLILFGLSIYLMVCRHYYDHYVNAFLIVSGVMLLLSPDRWINAIESLVMDLFNITDKKNKE